jgi:hypothetical protein
MRDRLRLEGSRPHPAIKGIREALFIGGTVGQLNKGKTLPLIEAARLGVTLKDPKAQLRNILPGSRQKGLSHSPAVPSRINIKMIEPRRPHG